MIFNLIGAGRLGKNIALALNATQIATLKCVYNQSMDGTQLSIKQLGFGKAAKTLTELPAVDVTWITCPDDAITPVVQDIANGLILKPGSFVIHCSGALSSCVLSPLKQQGCFVASIHFLKAFREGYLDAGAFNNVDCVIEGDEAVCNWLRSAFKQLGANIINITPEAKALYHAAACMASNYLVSLAACSERLFLKSGLQERDAKQVMLNLMQTSLNNLNHAESISEALTGPIVRGDVETVALHLDTLDDPVFKKLYKAAGLVALGLSSLSEEKEAAIRSLLQ